MIRVSAQNFDVKTHPEPGALNDSRMLSADCRALLLSLKCASEHLQAALLRKPPRLPPSPTNPIPVLFIPFPLHVPFE